jgi:hypothetical protein
MGLFDGVPDRRLCAFLLGYLSFFDHISSSDKLEAKIIAKLLGCLKFEGHNLITFLEVRLKPIDYNGLAFHIELVSKLLCKQVDSYLD